MHTPRTSRSAVLEKPEGLRAGSTSRDVLISPPNSAGAEVACSIWGFDYKFTNYDLRTNLIFKQQLNGTEVARLAPPEKERASPTKEP